MKEQNITVGYYSIEYATHYTVVLCAGGFTGETDQLERSSGRSYTHSSRCGQERKLPLPVTQRHLIHVYC